MLHVVSWNRVYNVAESEYCVITPGTHSVRWVRSFMYELGCAYRRATPVYTDNTTALSLAQNPVHHTRMKQIHLKYLALRELTNCNVIALGKVDTAVNPADIGTKALGAAETEIKSELFFEGIENLTLEPVECKFTIDNDASV